MTTRTPLALATIAAFLAVAALAAPLAGCAYDYAQHTDRVSFSGGNAVKANLEAETTNPSKRSMYSVRGLGANGNVVPATATGPAGATN